MKTILRFSALLWVSALPAVFPAFAQDVVPVDSGTLVPTEVSEGQRRSAAAFRPSGDQFIVWESDVSGGSDADGSAIQGRFFDSAGASLGGEFQINTATDYDQRFPDLAPRPDGFVVVWDSGVGVDSGGQGGDGWGGAIRAVRTDSLGVLQGAEFQVNTYTFYEQRYPRVAANASGEYVVVWQSLFSVSASGASEEIRARRFDSAGTALGSEIAVHVWTTGDQTAPAVALADDGSFVVVWESEGSSGGDDDGKSVQARLFDSDGQALGAEFQVNTGTFSDQVRPDVDVLAGGGFVVVWTGFGDAGCCLQFRRFDASGAALGGEQAAGAGFLLLPRLLASERETFVVVWGGDGGEQVVGGRRFDASGTPIGAPFTVSPEGADDQTAPTIAGDPQGRFVVAWQRGDLGQSASYDVWSRRFLAPLFYDGFETGDLTAWSGVVP